MTIKIIGAGLGRTGTASTWEAFNILNFEKNYHMREVMVTGWNHVDLWIKAYNHKLNGEIDECKKVLKHILDNYDTTLDYPGAIFYKELMDIYPEAKVVLTVRDDGYKWADSVNGSIGMIIQYQDTLFHKLAALLGAQPPIKFNRMNKLLVDTDGLMINADRQGLSNFHDDYNQKVIATIPSNRLLVFNVKQGWAPLCKFLNLPIPNIEYPRVNSSQNFQKNLGIMKILDLIIVVSFSIALWFAFKRNFEIAGCCFCGYLSTILLLKFVKPKFGK